MRPLLLILSEDSTLRFTKDLVPHWLVSSNISISIETGGNSIANLSRGQQKRSLG